MYRILKTGFIFFLIFLLGVILTSVSIKSTVEKNCLETDLEAID